LLLLLGGCTEAMPEDSGSGGGGGVVGGGVGGSSAGAAGSSSLPLGGSGAGAASAPGAQPSAGCGKAATQALETFVEAHVTAKGFDRQYFVRLPTGYDPQRAYATVVVGAACGGK